jgi:hypothetical protein
MHVTVICYRSVDVKSSVTVVTSRSDSVISETVTELCLDSNDLETAQV